MEPEEIQQSEINRRAAIQLSIEIDSNFKLYAHRVISHEAFVSRTQELVSVFHYSTEKKNIDNLEIIDSD